MVADNKKTRKNEEDPSVIRGNIKILYLTVVCCWFAGIAISLVLRITIEPLAEINPIMDSLFLTFSVFIFTMLFFGYAAPLIMLAVGMMQEPFFEKNPMKIMLAAPILLSAYAGVICGIYLRRDMQGKDNLFDRKKQILIYVGVAIALSIAIPVLITVLAATA